MSKNSYCFSLTLRLLLSTHAKRISTRPGLFEIFLSRINAATSCAFLVNACKAEDMCSLLRGYLILGIGGFVVRLGKMPLKLAG